MVAWGRFYEKRMNGKAAGPANNSNK